MGFFGVDNYSNKGTKSLLIISVFLMIMTSYYYSVVGIIVLCIYYLHEYLYYHKELIIRDLIKEVIKFGLTMFVGVLLAGILLVPTAYTILAGRNDGGEVYKLSKLLIPDMKFYDAFKKDFLMIFLRLKSFLVCMSYFFEMFFMFLRSLVNLCGRHRSGACAQSCSRCTCGRRSSCALAR